MVENVLFKFCKAFEEHLRLSFRITCILQIGRYIFAVCQYAFLSHALHYRYNISFA